MGRKFLIVFIFLGSFRLSYGQDSDCKTALDRAKQEFDAGQLEAVPGILENCLKKFTADEKIQAYKLLTITNLYLDDYPAAKNSFKSLLDTDPEYKIAPSDPIELEYLSKEFITTPIISLSAKIGTNLSTVSVIHRNTLSAEPDNNYKYKPGFGFVVNGGLELHFSKTLSLNLEAGVDYRRYNYTDVLFKVVEPQEIEQSSSVFFVNIPISFRYTIATDLKGERQGEKRIYYPYFYLGYVPSFNYLAANSSLRSPFASPKVTGPSREVLKKTTFFSQSLIFGLGLKRSIVRREGRKYRYQYVFVDLRYRYGLSNMLDEKNQYNFDDFAIKDEYFRYLVGSDDYLLSSFELTIGYIWPQHDTRRKNTATIQTVVGKMFGKKDKKNE